MAESVGPMGPASSGSLNGPPPLPREASKRAPNLMLPEEQGLGIEAANPIIQAMELSKQIEQIGQKLALLSPQSAQEIAMLVTGFQAVAAQSVTGAAQPQGGGAPLGGGMSPMPMPPMMGAGAGGGQPY